VAHGPAGADAEAGRIGGPLLQRARGYDEDAEVVRRLLRDHMAATATSEDEQDVS
jgi:hypothetical protein